MSFENVMKRKGFVVFHNRTFVTNNSGTYIIVF